MQFILYGLCIAAAGYCGLYAAYCFKKRKAAEGVSAGALALLAAGSVLLLMLSL